HNETSNLAGLITKDLIDGPWPFEMETRFQRRAAALPPEAFQQSLFVRVDDDKGGRKKQRAELEQDDQQHSFLEKREYPRLGNFESELVIQRLGCRRNQAAGLPEQTNETAFVEQSRRLALDARTIYLQDEPHDRFDRRQRENRAESVSDVQIDLRKTEKH